ncbi:hypothetical protein IG631_02114 [Alternaria alternata]|nr:hypothetical protein IG631_02114 [Alternaria alternata]
MLVTTASSRWRLAVLGGNTYEPAGILGPVVGRRYKGSRPPDAEEGITPSGTHSLPTSKSSSTFILHSLFCVRKRWIVFILSFFIAT